MTDNEAVQQVINTYVLYANLADYEAMAATYSPDGVWEIGGMPQVYTGPSEIIAKSREMEAKFTFVDQSNAPAVIVIDGDHATAQSLIRESSKYADCNRVLEVFGLYSDELVRTADGWKFARRHFKVLNMIEYAALPPLIYERMKEWNR